ncbi:hypothetical protein D3C81_1822680 [compost metagenome]
MPLEPFAAHHLQLGLVTHPNMRQFGFLEEAVDPERVLVDHRHLRLAGARVVTAMDVEVGDVAIDRGKDPGALEVELGRRQLRLGLLVIGQRRVGDVAGIVTVLPRDHQVVHVGAAMGVDLAHFPGGLA